MKTDAFALADAVGQRDDIGRAHVVGFALFFEAGEIEDIVDEAGEAFAFPRDDAEVAGTFFGVADAVVGEEFGEHADRGERGFELVGNVRDEIGFLAREVELAPGVGRDEIRAGKNRRKRDGNQQGERGGDHAGGLGQLTGIREIEGNLPVGQNLADFGRDKGTLPVALCPARCRRHRAGAVV